MNDWTVIVRENSPIVWQTAYRLLGNYAESCDCYQETFLSALKTSRRQAVRSWPALLQRIAMTQAINQLRRRVRRARRSENLGQCDHLPSSNPGPQQEVEKLDSIAQLRQALARLPEQEAEILCLRYLGDLSYDQIAQELGIKPNSIGPLLHRARLRLKGLLESTATVPNREV